MTIRRTFLVVAMIAACRVATSADREGDRTAKIDALFSQFSASTPGCAVGVAENGAPVVQKGYGSADLEHDVPIGPETIFEAGSVSKQFTAAAMLLLVRDGKLSLDDPVRKYIPELPVYPPSPSRPTIRHMLNHTSGLRDWGSVAAIAGWPRTTRVHTHAHVLEIVSQQRSLNFAPGERFSYSNTGFNLAAIIVSRVSGVPFTEFTRERIFKPLGMSHTSWRDDYTRVVKGRAIAYDKPQRDGSFHTDMPFENVYGNGGLLTTVGDLLKWNQNFMKPVVGDAAFVAEEQRSGTFNDGRPIGYGLGLYIGTHRGLPEVYHSGSTAGYRAFLTRFPEQQVSVAVLCNVDTNATTLAHGVADVVLGGRLRDDPAIPPPPARELYDGAGLYRSELTGATTTLGRDRMMLRERRWWLDGKGTATATDRFGTVEKFVRVVPAHPNAQALAAFAGSYSSDEAGASFVATVEGQRLVLKQRPSTSILLAPLYADAFDAASLGTVIFHRAKDGHVTGFSVVQERVWDMPFVRKDAS
jgi:CubicO group peptidase (beta-lactamase class C family)